MVYLMQVYQTLWSCYDWTHFGSFKSSAPGRFRFNFSKVIFKLISVNDGWGISYEIALRWVPKDRTDDKSTLVQVMAWYRQATSYYLSQCWPRSMSPNGVTRPQWVKRKGWHMDCPNHNEFHADSDQKVVSIKLILPLVISRQSICTTLLFQYFTYTFILRIAGSNNDLLPNGLLVVIWTTIKLIMRPKGTYLCLNGKPWYLQHNCVGDTIVYH